MFTNRIIIVLALIFSGSLLAGGTDEQNKASDTVGAFFQGQINGANYYLGSQGVVFQGGAMTDYAEVSMMWANASEDMAIYAVDAEGTYTDVREMGLVAGQKLEKVVYENIYFNIDLVVYPASQAGHQLMGTSLQYEFIVYPGGNPNEISLEYTDGLAKGLNKEGDLVVGTELGSMYLAAPTAYQDVAGISQSTINIEYNIQQNRLHLATGSYEQAEVVVLRCEQRLKAANRSAFSPRNVNRSKTHY